MLSVSLPSGIFSESLDGSWSDAEISRWTRRIVSFCSRYVVSKIKLVSWWKIYCVSILIC